MSKLQFPSSKFEGYRLINEFDLHKFEANYSIKDPVCQYCDKDIPDGEYYIIFEGDPVCQDCEDRARSKNLEW
jgi:hypothetical protein